MRTFGETLQNLRLEKQLTQKEMGLVVGLGERQYRAYEGNKVDVTLSKLIDFADYFNVSLEYLAGRTDER